MKRKLVLLVMVVFLGLTALIGCDNGSTPDPQPTVVAPTESEDELTVTLNMKALALEVGQSSTLIATVSIDGLAVDWTTSDANVATVKDGKVTAVAAGVATITAKSGTASDTCTVTVTAPAPTVDPTIVEEEGYDGEINFSNTLAADAVDLTLGLTATDSEGNTLEITVTDNGGFDIKKLGSYTISYQAIDANGRTATFTRVAKVTYFGLDKETIDSKEVSQLTSWTYVAESDDAKTAMEWGQRIVPGHSTNWNRFEGPTGMPYIVMHGSDTNGREVGGVEVDDEDPNTMLFNKVTITEENSLLRVFLSNNPYPDYNNLLSKVRLTVLDLTTYEPTVIGGYREIKAPLNAAGDGLNYDQMRNLTYEDFDLSAFVGKTVMLCLEQDAPEDVYQWDYYLDIGYLDFQIQPLIAETRDTLVVYSMSFVQPEEQLDLSQIALDTATSWGTDDADAGLWGLRGDEASKAKWQVVFLNSAVGHLNNVTGTGASLQLIAWEQENTHDGAIRVPDAALVNRVNVGNNKYFEIYIGTDTDSVNVNYRLCFYTADGTKVALTPLFDVNGYTPIGNNWATIQKCQWTHGVKLIYDVTQFANQEVVVAIEVDENFEAGVGNCTLWINKLRFVEDMTFAPADYTAYNELKAAVEEANYQEATYTEMSWSIFVEALTKFNTISKDLVNEQQGDIDAVVTNLQDAVNLLTVKPEPVTPPADPTDGTLSEDVLDFDNAAWKSDEVDASGVWGTDAANGEYWGLRGDTAAKAAWSWYIGEGNGMANGISSLKMSIQSIAYEQGNDVDNLWAADALFANKVWVRGEYFMLNVGCDDNNGTVNMRLRVVLSDGTIVLLEPIAYNNEQVTKAENGWYTVHYSQWVYGTQFVYDFSEYYDDVVTILIEQDQNETAPGTSCTLWFNKAEFVKGADYTAYNELKAAVEEANYNSKNYTSESFVLFTEALTAFNALPLNLVAGEQAKVDAVVSKLEKAILGLVELGDAQLAEEVLGLTTSEWKAMEADSKTVWGDDNADAGSWGLRGAEDLETKKDWSFYPGANATLYQLDNPGGSLQSVAWETDNDANGISIDALFANKVVVSLPNFTITVGCDTPDNYVNIRLRLILEDGTFVILEPSKYVEGEYTPLENGWATVKAGQWVYGTAITYDFSKYVGQTVTILLEQDCYDGANPTLWFNRALFSDVTLQYSILTFDDAAWKALKVDTCTEWGDDNADAGSWGLRGAEDLEAKTKWTYFPGANATLYQLDNAGGSLQSVAWETENDTNGWGADALFANKVVVAQGKFVVTVGCDGPTNSINVRLSLVLSDGTIVHLTPVKTSSRDGSTYAAGEAGWGTVTGSQWVYGLDMEYDMSAYLGQTVTILLEQDCYDGANPTLWLNRVAFVAPGLEYSILAFDDAAWKALAVDASTEWGDDNADAGLWGLRGAEDLEAKTKWTYFPGANATLYQLDNAGGSLQSVAWETGNDTNGWGADALFANKVVVAQSKFVVTAGCDTAANSINFRVSLVLEDGKIVHLTPVKTSSRDGSTYVAGEAGWGTITGSQWVYGLDMEYDMSAYLGQTVTILLEQDAYDDANPTLWLNRVAFVAPGLEYSILTFDDAAWKALEVDNSTEWGDDNADAGLWGLRGQEDLEAKTKWSYFGGTLNYLDNAGGSLQSIAWETENDTNGWAADALFVNKVVVAQNKFVVTLGCDTAANSINVRISLVLADGSIVHLTPANTSSKDGSTYVAGEAGWGTVTGSQWVYGLDMEYDMSAYLGQTVTILVEQDAYDGANPTMWLNRLVFVA